MVGLGEIVRIESQMDEDMTVGWDNKWFKIPAHGSAFIPTEAAFSWFGDPRATANVRTIRDENGTVHYVPDRETELRRLNIKYGNPFDEPFLNSRPYVKMFDTDGEEILTVLDDPTGELSDPSLITVLDSQADTTKALKSAQSMLQQQQAEIEELKQFVRNVRDGEANAEFTSLIEDSTDIMGTDVEQDVPSPPVKPIRDPKSGKVL